MTDLLDWLIDLGRPGGAVMIGVSVLLVVGTLVVSAQTGRLFIWPLGVAIAFLVPGLVMLVLGNPANKHVTLKEPALTDDALLEALATRPRPLWVCTRCRNLVGPGSCITCGTGSEVYAVETDEDMRMVLLALER